MHKRNDTEHTTTPNLWDFIKAVALFRPQFHLWNEVGGLTRLLLCSVTNSCLTLCNPMDGCTSGFPVPHHLLEFAQTHVHRVSDTIETSHPLSSPSPAFNLSQDQGLFQWVGSSYQVAKVLALQHQSFPGWFPLGLTGLISWQFKVLSRVFSSTTFQKHQFLSAQTSLWSNSHIHTWLLEKP